MRALRLFAVVPFAAVLAGCQALAIGETRSGRALEARAGAAFTQLFGNVRALAGGEVGRTRAVVRAAREHPLQPLLRTTGLYRETRSTTGRTWQRTVQLRDTARRVFTVGSRRLGNRLADLERNSRSLAAPLATGTRIRDLRDGVANVRAASDFGRYLLRGPGDPDRSTDPSVTRRQESYVERLLRRF